MCGIAGIIKYKDNPIENINAMNEKLHRRGPDAGDYWLCENDRVVLGHRRLAIVDLTECGSQPMVSAGERYVMVYNGEIYNALELKQQMEKAFGHVSYRGTSDTEILLRAIECYGLKETLIKCRGMFGLAVYDRQEKVLCLARDRMGEKPLYTNGEFLYRTNTDGEGADHIWQYEMDQSSAREITSGTIVGMNKNNKVLYYLKQEEGEESSFWTYHTESKAMHKMYEGEESYLAFDDEWVYHYGKTDAGVYINRNRLDKLEEEENLLGTSLDADEIPCFYVTDSHLLFAAGVHEGSGGYFYGDFYSFNLETKKLGQKHLSDDDSFVVFDGKIYYSKYSNEGNRKQPSVL